jgi:ribosomal protein S11
LVTDKIKVWFDAEADFLEVRFSEVAGYAKATANDAVMERLDAEGRVVGFSILGVSRFKKSQPLLAELASA